MKFFIIGFISIALISLFVTAGFYRFYYGGKLGHKVVQKKSFSFKDTLVNLNTLSVKSRNFLAENHPEVKSQMEVMGIIKTDEQIELENIIHKNSAYTETFFWMEETSGEGFSEGEFIRNKTDLLVQLRTISSGNKKFNMLKEELIRFIELEKELSRLKTGLYRTLPTFKVFMENYLKHASSRWEDNYPKAKDLWETCSDDPCWDLQERYTKELNQHVEQSDIFSNNYRQKVNEIWYSCELFQKKYTDIEQQEDKIFSLAQEDKINFPIYFFAHRALHQLVIDFVKYSAYYSITSIDMFWTGNLLESYIIADEGKMDEDRIRNRAHKLANNGDEALKRGFNTLALLFYDLALKGIRYEPHTEDLRKELLKKIAQIGAMK